MNLEILAELQAAVGMRDRQRALDVVGDGLAGGIGEIVERQQQDNLVLKDRNSLIYREIDDLTSGLEAIEELSRNDLGYIKQGETFYRIIPKEKDQVTEPDGAPYDD